MQNYWIGDRSAGLTSYVRTSHHLDDPLQFYFFDDALRFLRQAISNSDALCSLRIWAVGRGASAPRSDRELLSHAAASLVSGELVVRPYTLKPLSGHADHTEEIESDPEEIVRRPRRRVASSRPQKAADSEPDINIEQQIAALRAAAKAGTPFCEQCERARLEAAR
jgi:nucleoside-diphosphate-sugar epimerase